MKKTKTSTIRKIQIFWSIFIGLGAVLGAAMMFLSPSGEMFGMTPMLPLLRRLPLSEIFFNDFIWPGIALLLANGVTNGIAFTMLMKRSRYGGLAGGICGIILMLWITVQFVIFPINFMSSVFFLFGLLQAVNGFILYHRENLTNENV